MADNTDDLIISISTDQATLRRSIKRIEQDLGTLAGSVQKQFSAVGKSIDNSVSSTLQNRINGMVGIGKAASKEWTGALADQGKELERLRARYSPLFATINQYKTAVADIKQAHALGAISANEMATAISRERQAALASTAAIKGRNAALAAAPSQRSGGGFQTANIAAQFQDIAVTSAMGMNPLQIALQQGTQLSSVLATMGNGKQVIGGLAAAFTSLVSPVSLVTIGLIAGGAAAIQYFSSIATGGDQSAEKLKEQAQLIQDLAARWGDVIPALREYANELARAKDAADIRQGVSLVNEKTLESVRKGIEDTRATYAAFVADLRVGGEEPEVIKQFEDAYQQFAKAANEGKLEAADVQRVQDALAAAINSSGIPAVSEFKKAFDELSASAETAAKKVGESNEALRAIPESAWRSFNPQTGKLETNGQPWDENIQNPGFMTPETGPTPQSRPNIELEGLPGADKADKTARRWFSTSRAGRISGCCNNRSAAWAARSQATPSSWPSICSISTAMISEIPNSACARHLLEDLVPAGEQGDIRLSEEIEADGDALLRIACEHGLEGIIAKDRNSTYRSGRLGDWLKIKCVQSDGFVIVGYEKSSASFGGIGRLLLAARKGSELVYVGGVGTGFNERSAAELRTQMDKLVIGKPAIDTRRKRNAVFVRPELVAEIEYRAWTHDGKLRHASYKGLREAADQLPVYELE